ncbi:MAG: DUF861 domain-containing protein [Desulfovibrio sp.]|nr:DUF861 domain-containing protein [Desulfovibrio sp.]
MQMLVRLDGTTDTDNAEESVAPNPLAGHPATRVCRKFVHPEGLLNAGTWECAPGSFVIPSHPHYEICTILEGEGSIELPDGSRMALAPGACVFIRKGAHTTWHVEKRIKKTFLCCDPREAGDA